MRTALQHTHRYWHLYLQRQIQFTTHAVVKVARLGPIGPTSKNNVIWIWEKWLFFGNKVSFYHMKSMVNEIALSGGTSAETDSEATARSRQKHAAITLRPRVDRPHANSNWSRNIGNNRCAKRERQIERRRESKVKDRISFQRQDTCA